jgi:predicted DNA-binding protein
MVVLKPRKRLVSLRLSDDEYERLVELRSAYGAHSTSDLARTAVCSFLERAEDPRELPTPAVAELQAKVGKMEAAVRRLSRKVSAGTGAKN